MEECCDYITISSVDAFTGIKLDNQPTILTLVVYLKLQNIIPASQIINFLSSFIYSSENQTATVKGPVVIITFSSDHAVTQTGFFLQFRLGTEMSEKHPYTYRLMHHNYPYYNLYVSKVEPNQVTIMAFSTESTRRRRDLTVTKISRQVMRQYECRLNSQYISFIFSRYKLSR